jgi:penicillin-binding protein 1A
MSQGKLTQTWPLLAALALTAVIAGLAIMAGAYYYLAPSLPSAEILRDVELQTPLRIYSRDGRLMAQIGEKRRTPASYEEIPEIVVNAFLAAEDDRFFEHPGYDYQGITRAVINLIMTGSRSQGGSTITQQLARVYFLTRDRTFVRKAKELILALQIEREFSKQEILALYLNKIFLGQRAYGVGAAAEVYFGKSLQKLNIAEAATIAGMPKAPSYLNPVTSIERATKRRAYVLRRMLELDFITTPQHNEALAFPMESHRYGPKVEMYAPYVTEMVRADLVRRYGLDAYTDGYKVVSTINSQHQKTANDALSTALLEYDRRHGYRGPVAQNILDPLLIEAGIIEDTLDPERTKAGRGNAGGLDDTALAKLLSRRPRIRELHNAVVLGTREDNSALLYVQNSGRVQVPWDNLKWRPFINDNIIGGAPESIEDVVAVGDLIRLLYTADKGWTLAQTPQVQGAFVVLDPQDGATVALVGGFDYSLSKFNRAVQIKRQPGSSFKPFIYSAALENGFTTATLVNDAPVVFDDSELETAWRPENYSRKFHGPIRLREALIKSLNLVSVRILRGTGLGPAIRHIEPFGLPKSALPRDLSLALGSGGTSPMEVAGGYAAFASGGFRTEPYLVERILDMHDNVVFEHVPAIACQNCVPLIELNDGGRPGINEPAQIAPTITEDGPALDDQLQPVPVTDTEIPPYPDAESMIEHGLKWRPTAEETPAFFAAADNPPARAITPENAYLIYDMMRDVIQRGTGRRARDLGRRDLAGKTGTSNDRRDAWFSGYNGDLVATAWVGFDQDRSLGAGEEGSRTALPIWKYFMKDALSETRDATIPRPPGIITARIVPETGLVAPAGYSGAIFELFREGHVPDQQPSDTGTSIDFTGGGNGLDDEDIF